MSDGPINADDIEWTDHDHEGGERRFRRKQLGDAAGNEALGTSLYEVPAGKRTWLRHYHEGNEEALFVLEGQGTLRLGPDAETHALEAGDYVALPAGEESAHEIEGGDGGLRMLMVSTMNTPDITVYPDEEMVGLYSGSAPGGEKSERTLSRYLDATAEVAYWDE